MFGKGSVPGRAGFVQHPAGKAHVMPAAQRLEPEIMAHPYIMDDPSAVTEAFGAA